MSNTPENLPEKIPEAPDGEVKFATPVRKPQKPFWEYLYTHNPFYVISAVLLIFAVRAAYGELQIGYINCGMLIGVLAVYTMVLAAIAVVLIRFGKVWDDVRSVLLLCLLMFLAISVGADDLFVAMDSTRDGASLMLLGFVFAAILSEAVLLFSGIRLAVAYRLPYYLFLALFFAAPWLLAPSGDTQDARLVEWLLLAFPTAAGAILLLLIPAVRRGAETARSSGTPWPWPWFPWSIFAFLAGGAALRSYALSLTFGPTGPIWSIHETGRSIVLATIWGSYFLVPMLFAVMVLIAEAGIVRRNTRLLNGALVAAPALVVLALPWGQTAVFESFYLHVTETFGSPLWMAVMLLITLYGVCWLRGVRWAGYGAVAALGVATVVHPTTIGFDTLAEPNAYVLIGLATIIAADGFRRLSSWSLAASAFVAVGAVYLWLDGTELEAFRHSICLHVLWPLMIAIGLACRDWLGRTFSLIGAGLFPVVTGLVLFAPQVETIPAEYKVGYVTALLMLLAIVAGVHRSPVFAGSAAICLGIGAYEGIAIGFRMLAQTYGWMAVSALVWSIAALIGALIISSHKAKWIPARMFSRWRGHATQPSDASGSS
ncbi:hypothetical protein [Stratiformator vulcanicus]|uniref:Uncharacterized protein n=1 Tax=Stratiformator vulcanicus TaxID=2527980 RepID=A0A517QW31_9PLAN|nr:hypothetical protein [Stratiformator vulcanicus]QDT35875.1 hypothetical protein Pan189_02280 [Stratiformator vulcanicus]